MKTRNMPFSINEKKPKKTENHSKLYLICSQIFPKGFRKGFETAVVNEPSVFEPSKFYCIFEFTNSVDPDEK